MAFNILDYGLIKVKDGIPFLNQLSFGDAFVGNGRHRIVVLDLPRFHGHIATSWV